MILTASQIFQNRPRNWKYIQAFTRVEVVITCIYSRIFSFLNAKILVVSLQNKT